MPGKEKKVNLRVDVSVALVEDLKARLRVIVDKDSDFWKSVALQPLILGLAGRIVKVMPDVPVEEDREEQIMELCRQARGIMAVDIVSIAATISPESFEEVPTDATTDPVPALPDDN